MEEIRLEQQKEFSGVVFPLVLTNSNGSIDSTVQWVSENKQRLEELIAKHGAIYFRSVGLQTPEDFYKFYLATGYESGSFLGGGGPRNIVIGPIHTSTETPPHLNIPFHHELAYLSTTPSKLLFFCDIPTVTLGETPILLSNILYERLKEQRPQFVADVEAKGTRYFRKILDKSKCLNDYQRSWQDAFDTTDREIAEKRAKEVGTDIIEWKEDGSMWVTSEALPSVIIEPRTSKKIWFNSITLLHPYTHGFSDRSEAPWEPFYGDMTPISDEDIAATLKIMQEESVAIPWQKGDVLLVDNDLTLHSRSPFTPPRRILAAIVKRQ